MKRSISTLAGAGVLATALTALAALAAVAQPTTARTDKNQLISIVYGKVAAVEDVKLSSAASGGALVGGMVGVASQHGERYRDKVAGAAAGALLGALLTKAAEGRHKAQAFTVQENTGSTVKIIQDQADIRVGDCVAVEQGPTANVRRVADTMCEQGPHLSDTVIATSHQQDAGECNQAKQEVLTAKTDADFARAEKKVNILCH